MANTMNWNSVEAARDTISRFCLMTLSSLPTGSAGLRGDSSLIISATHCAENAGAEAQPRTSSPCRICHRAARPGYMRSGMPALLKALIEPMEREESSCGS